MTSSQRNDVLEQIIALAHTNSISSDDIAKAMKDAAPTRSRTPLFLAAIGGIFIFSGIAAFIGMFWDNMNSLSRVIITLGTGFALYVMGIAIAKNARFGKASAPLLFIAALLQPTGFLVFIDEYLNRGSDARYAFLLVSGIMLVQQALSFKATRQAVLLFFTLFFGANFFSAALSLLGASTEWISVVMGLSMICLASGLLKYGYSNLPGFWFFMGGVNLMAGLYIVLRGTSIELLYLFAACAMVYVSTLVRSTALMVVSVLSMLSYIAYFTHKHFVDSIGWPASLVFLGLVFVGAAAGAIKLKKKYL